MPKPKVQVPEGTENYSPSWNLRSIPPEYLFSISAQMLAARRAKQHGPGRNIDPTKPRCACGAMTLRMQQIRYHKCCTAPPPPPTRPVIDQAEAVRRFFGPPTPPPASTTPPTQVSQPVSQPPPPQKTAKFPCCYCGIDLVWKSSLKKHVATCLFNPNSPVNQPRPTRRPPA